ncbi:interleukin-1 receptor-associated kinase-like 2 isoform X3 [Oryctolagus cuniculus]|uniref:interleukin-1 receptor-associated kinase-like 2 isoform X3 n=1 Tax=Oryctolagus cuniculus TaxID=9986 RepID=UPI003879FC28
MPCYIHQLPAWVLDDLCRNMDTLNEWDWMQFGKPALETGSSSPPSLDPVLPGRPETSAEEEQPVGPAGQPNTGSPSAGAQQTFFPPLSEEDSSDSKQEPLFLAGDGLFWREADVVQATKDFSPSHRISQGTFADVYRGERHGKLYVFKTVREGACSSPGSIERFFQAEMEMCCRCCHPSVLPLLGFCRGRGFHSLVYPYMAHGSLQDRLHGQGGSDPLSWPQRVGICSGLLQAVQHLHSLDIIHSNIKSSNVLLDQNFAPKLAHPVAYLSPVNKKSKYTVMRTHLFQASAAYLPEDFIRVGQLTKRVDVFGCGIVLAEVLTGIPAVDSSRSPAYLKDLLLREIPSSAPSPCSRRAAVEVEAVREICAQFLDGRAGRPPAGCTEALAAACLCLRRRNASLDEVRESVAAVEEQLRPEGEASASNTPEETDDVDNSSLEASYVRTTPFPEAAASGLPADGEEGRPRASEAAEAASSSVASVHPGLHRDATGTSWKIEINEAKRKLMEDILLYKAEKLDSVELFGPL